VYGHKWNSSIWLIKSSSSPFHFLFYTWSYILAQCLSISGVLIFAGNSIDVSLAQTRIIRGANTRRSHSRTSYCRSNKAKVSWRKWSFVYNMILPSGNLSTHPPIHLFIHLFIHSFIYSFIHSFIHLCIHPFMRASMHPCIYSLIN